MTFQSVFANCGSARTYAFTSGHFQTCIRCEDCGHSEFRDDEDFEGDLLAVNGEM
jgi:hypothetical protein